MDNGESCQNDSVQRVMTVGSRKLRTAALGAVRRGWPVTPGAFLGPGQRWCGRQGARGLCPILDTWQQDPVTTPGQGFLELLSVTAQLSALSRRGRLADR